MGATHFNAFSAGLMTTGKGGFAQKIIEKGIEIIVIHQRTGKQRPPIFLSSLFALCGFLSPQANANELDPLFSLPLEELMNVNVSLTSRVEEKQFTTPAAVYVLTHEDIRRSGLRRIPELLRLIPGLHVAKIDANKWAITSRNSLSRFSSTMLVMIDGRSIYSPFYAGVYWESQDTFIEDIDRIEVVRGPGGSLWGTNAVDGIINIITKSTTKTQGSKSYALAGKGEMKYELGLRHGDRSENDIHYRAFAKTYKTDTGEYLDPNESTNNGLAPIGDDGNDEGKAERVGARIDWASGKDTYTLQANAYTGDYDEDRVVSSSRAPNRLSTIGHNLAANWKRKLSEKNSIAINAYYAQNQRDDDVLENDETTFDIDMQHSMQLANHHLVWGLGFRHYNNQAAITTPSNCSATAPCFAVDPETKTLETWSAFIQDRLPLSETFSLIVGSKFENNDYTGFEYQPTLRGLWTPDRNTTYWGAITRAVRVPDRVNTDGILNSGTSTLPIGDKDAVSFINYAYELGYRKRLSSRWALDGNVFYSDYQKTLEGASITGIDYIAGFEAAATHKYSSNLRLDMGYTYNEGKTVLASGGDRPRNRLPENTLHLRSFYSVNRNMEWDVMVYHADKSKSLSGNTDIPAYTRIDLRYGWQASKKLQTSLILTNILDDVHSEGIDTFKINTGTGRGIMLYATHSIDK